MGLTGYEEFQQIMSELNRRKALNELINKSDDKGDYLNTLRELFGI